MAKTKKHSQKKESNKIIVGQVKKRNYGFKVRDCVINLERLSKIEYDLYSHSNTIVSKSFDIKLRGNTAEINGKKHRSQNNTFTFEIKKDLTEIKYVECNPILQCNGQRKPQQTQEFEPKIIAKTLTAMINDKWKQSKAEFKSKGLVIEQNAIVMAKMAGYSAWPGRIVDFTKNGKRAHVYFFGSNNNGSVDATEIVPFGRCREVTRLLLLRKLGEFHRAVLEVERILGIPHGLSFTKESLAIDN